MQRNLPMFPVRHSRTSQPSKDPNANGRKSASLPRMAANLANHRSGTCQCSPFGTRDPVSLPKIPTRMSRKFAALPRMAANLANHRSGTCQCSPFGTRDPVSLPKIPTRMAANLAKVNVEEHANVPRSAPANPSAFQRSQREWPQIRCAPANGRESCEGKCSGTCQCSPVRHSRTGGEGRVSVVSCWGVAKHIQPKKPTHDPPE